MIELAQLLYYKNEHVGHKVIYVTLYGKDYVFRTLTRKEYSNIIQISTDDLMMEELVCQCACIYPEDVVFTISCPAGLPKRISPIIIESSNFTDMFVIYDIFKLEKSKTNTIEYQCECLVKATFPEFSLEEITNWTYERLITMSVRATEVLKIKGISYDFKIPEDTESTKKDVTMLMNDKEYITQLRKNGVDPMYYFSSELFKANELDMPIIIGSNWRNEVVIDGVRKQMEAKKIRKATSI